jgi:hypothetical protein
VLVRSAVPFTQPARVIFLALFQWPESTHSHLSIQEAHSFAAWQLLIQVCMVTLRLLLVTCVTGGADVRLFSRPVRGVPA